LKVLDGISIETAEQQQARDTFTGRLTEELLDSRLLGIPAAEIKILDLSNCKLRDFDDMFNNTIFPHLRDLNLSTNLFTSLRPIGFMPHLRILNLSNNKIESLLIQNVNILESKIGLNGLHNIEVLDISNNMLKDFIGMQFCQLKELKILKAHQNEITKIEYLDNLIQLKELDVNQNKIRQFDITSFSSTNSLKCLKIDDNGLKNFQNLQKLLKLQHLFANSNRINDFPDIEKLAELPYLKELEMNSNPITRKPGYRQTVIRKLPILLYLDGKEISPEERERNEAMAMGMAMGLGMGIPNSQQINNPMIFVNAQMNQSKVPVKLTAVNFETVFNNMKNGDMIPKK